jgi:hypothetical protein
MAGRFPDDQIAATLNRLGFRTGPGNSWHEGRVRAVRSYHQLPACNVKASERRTLTLEEASERLNVSHKIVRRLIDSGKIPAHQVVKWAPWQIGTEAIESEEVLKEVQNLKRRVRSASPSPETELPLFGERALDSGGEEQEHASRRL